MKFLQNQLFKISLLVIILFSQTLAQNQLDKYVEEGVSNNIVLQQKRIQLEKAMYSLKTAASYFLPSVDLEGSYTSGEGGRNISFPVGDMLNPVYATLNQLTQGNNFPQLENQTINFFPFHFYDVKVHTTMPLLNTDIIINHSIQDESVKLKQNEVNIYKRELIKNIKSAYFNYLSAVAVKNIYDNSLKVAEEGKRVNESLLKNGAGLPVYILRSESEIAELNSKRTEAVNNINTAKRYFNFLLNRNIEEDIDTSFNIELKISEIDQLLANDYDYSTREEMEMLETAKNISESALLMNKLYWVPKINAFLDLGAQDKIWNYNSDSRYYLFGFQLSVPIFEGFRNSYKVDEAELEVKNIQYNLELTKNQIELSQSIAKDNLMSAKENYYTAITKYKAASSYETLIERGYKEGANTFIETIDARSQLTQAALLLNINTNKVLIALANYESEITVSQPEDQ